MLPFLCGNFVQRASGSGGDRQNKAGGTGGAACFGKRPHCGGTGADLGGKREAGPDQDGGYDRIMKLFYEDVGLWRTDVM